MLETAKQKIAIAKAQKLPILDLRNCGLLEIPPEVFELEHLTHLLLGVRKCEEKVYDPSLGWVEETSLFHNNCIANVPPNIAALT